MHCPKCVSEKFVKSGFTKGKQRYKYKKCGCNFTQSQKKGATLETKIMALKLYLEGMGFRSIGRVLKVSNVTVLYWLQTLGRYVKTYVNTHLPDDMRDVDFVEMDEMWHFTVTKNKLWLWIAIGRFDTAAMVYTIGDRSKKARKRLLG